MIEWDRQLCAGNSIFCKHTPFLRHHHHHRHLHIHHSEKNDKLFVWLYISPCDILCLMWILRNHGNTCTRVIVWNVHSSQFQHVWCLKKKPCKITWKFNHFSMRDHYMRDYTQCMTRMMHAVPECHRMHNMQRSNWQLMNVFMYDQCQMNQDGKRLSTNQYSSHIR